MKNSKALILALALILVSTAAWAQGRFVVTPHVGYRTVGTLGGDIAELTDFKVQDGLAYGLALGYRVSPVFTIEAMWSRVDSNITALSGASEIELTKISTDQWHANFLYYFRGDEAKACPYLLFALGATALNPKPLEFEGENIDPSSETRFTGALGGGIQVNASEKVGLRAQVKYCPTYINSSNEIWIDWWGYAWVVPVSNYMNQWEFTAGLTFRF
jgi:opacity protein-like surface antigen